MLFLLPFKWCQTASRAWGIFWSSSWQLFKNTAFESQNCLWVECWGWSGSTRNKKHLTLVMDCMPGWACFEAKLLVPVVFCWMEFSKTKTLHGYKEPAQTRGQCRKHILKRCMKEKYDLFLELNTCQDVFNVWVGNLIQWVIRVFLRNTSSRLYTLLSKCLSGFIDCPHN